MPSPGALELLIVLIIVAMFVVPVVVIVRALRPMTGAATPERDPALDLLRQRFAAGEIDEVEYKRLCTALQAP
jgi:uncharacterized membrane protein